MSIKQKIFISMIVLTIVCSASVQLFSIILFNNDLKDAANQRISVTAMLAEHEIDQLKSMTHVAAMRIAENEGLKELLVSNYSNDIYAKIIELQKITGMDFCAVVDNKGILMAKTANPAIPVENVANQPEINSALSGITITSVVKGVTIRLLLVTGTPIYDGDSNIIGAVSVGFVLDNQKHVNLLKEITGCEVSIFDGNERIATTLANNEGLFAEGTIAEARVSEQVLRGYPFIGKTYIEDKEILTKYAPLYGADNEIIGMIAVGEYTATDANKLLSFVVYGIIITLAILAVSIFIAVFITRTIDRQMNVLIKKVREADERMRLMFDSMPLCASFWNKDDKSPTDCNQEAVNLFGLHDKKEYVERFLELSPEYQPSGRLSDELAMEYRTKAYEDGNFRFEWMHQKLNGEPIPCEITLTRVKYNDDYVIAGYTRDLREIKAMINEIRRIEIAEESNKAKSDFLANMSHEMRTPMNAILGIAEMQLQDELLPKSIRETMGMIQASGELLLRIINDLLDMSKIEAGKFELMPVKYDTASLINDTMMLNISKLGSAQIEFKLFVDEHIPAILFGDELRIKQVLNNLLSNACKYTKEGMIMFAVSMEPMEKGDDSDEVTLIFRVTDTGIGMTEEDVKKLFDEYSRFNMDANRTTQGTGLGMSITKKLLNMMNGGISVTSTLNLGSEFIVRIPQKKIGSNVLGKELADNLQRFQIHSMKQIRKSQIIIEPMPYGSILIVDDVESNSYVAKGLMKPYKLKVDSVTSGFAAIEKIKAGNIYDIIFMDHMMPKMDGVEATKNIRELGYEHPIVALTANAVVGQSDVFLQNGFDGFVAKPIDMRELNAALKKFVRDKQPPEVLKAVRLQYDTDEGKAVDTTYGPVIDSELTEIFLRDAASALTILEKPQVKQHDFTDDDIKIYIITVHGIKSSLANIGEEELSAAAYKLEQAGRNRDTNVMENETSAFIKNLKILVKRLTPTEAEASDESVDEDLICLRENLTLLQSACSNYDKKVAKDAMNKLKQKEWSSQTKERLNKISEYMLFSDFEKVSAIADEILKTM